MPLAAGILDFFAIFTYHFCMKESNFGQLSQKNQDLLAAAETAMQKAFNPGSGFVVGAALSTPDGQVFTGANIKISSTGMVACAEVVAFMAAHMAGVRKFDAIAVIARHGDRMLVEPNYPCGRCSQIIHEFSALGGQKIEMVYSNTDKSRIAVGPISDFLPTPFVSGIFRDEQERKQL
jgi:cytidine deaminase